MLTADRNIKLGNQQVKRLYLNNSVIWNTLWTPSEISTLFWYDPSDANTITTSGSNVTQVDDKSGNNYTLTPEVGLNPPLIGTRFLNGLNVLEWVGNNCLENNSFNYNQSATPLNFAFVVYHDTIGTQEFYFSGTESTGDPRVYSRRLSDGRYDVAAATRLIAPIASAIQQGQPYLIVSQMNAGSSLVRINGDQKSSGNIGTNPFAQLRLGHNESELSDLDGYFAEIIGFADNTKQEIVEGYLAWKWGLAADLPAGHAYKTEAPRT